MIFKMAVTRSNSLLNRKICRSLYPKLTIANEFTDKNSRLSSWYDIRWVQLPTFAGLFKISKQQKSIQLWQKK